MFGFYEISAQIITNNNNNNFRVVVVKHDDSRPRPAPGCMISWPAQNKLRLNYHYRGSWRLTLA